MNKSKGKASLLFYSLLCTALLAFIIVWQLFFRDVSYYVPAAIMLVFSMLPLLFRFEKRESTAKEITLTASLVALAVVSRAVFYLLPSVKPIAAVVIVAAVCLGAERGYIVGVFSAFISNFIFGQGPWTPFQMAALGLVGFLAGIIFKRINHNRVTLAVTGFLLVFIYGAIADISTLLVIYGQKLTLQGILSVYSTGAPFTLVFAVSTAAFLLVFGTPFIDKLSRVITKYEIIKKTEQ